MNRIGRLAIGLAFTIVTVLTACNLGTQPPPVDTVIIPDTTKVANSATRQALTGFDLDSGVMHFSGMTPQLRNLSPGDVLVAKPSVAAPAGYLRKVEAVRQVGGEVVLETSQANLTDAVTKGGFDSEGEFSADDVASISVHLRGVTANAVPAPAGLAPEVGVGDNYSFQIGFDEVELTIGEGDVTVDVKLNGELYFNVGWGVHLDIDPCLDIPPVCVDSFEAKIGVEQWLGVSLSGEANATLTKEFKVASYYFKPLIFFIGPVPIVVVPSIEVFVGASGEVRLDFSYGVTQTAQSQLGARWTPDQGWRNITGFGVDLEGHDEFSFNATMKARAYARTLTSLKLYDLTGPALGLMLAAELDGAIPRNPTWIARGIIQGDVAFVVGLPIVGTLDEYRSTLFSESIELLRSSNQAPRFSNVTSGILRVDLRVPVYLGQHSGFVRGQFDVLDPEGDPFTLSARSDRDGTFALPQQKYAFATPGLRTLTVTARDNGGKTSSISLRIDVINTPPSLFIQHSGDPHQGESYRMVAQIIDPNEEDTTRLCSGTSWEVDAPDTLSRISGCRVQVIFGESGTRRVQVSTHDTEGRSASVTVTLNVLPPPDNPYPRIVDAGVTSWEFRFVVGTFLCTPVSVADGSTIDFRDRDCILFRDPPGPRYLASVTVENPDNEVLTYDWRVYVTRSDGEVLLNSALGSSSSIFAPTSPGNAIDVTDDCYITVQVNAPDPSRSKSLIVWSGRCTYYSTRIA